MPWFDATVFDRANGYNANQGKVAPAFEAAAAVGGTACRITAPPGQTAGPVSVPTLAHAALWALAAMLRLAAGGRRRTRG